ncbi:hypothetical protein FBY50_1206 [Zymomonas mobilis]|uniref:chemotaxis protein n=1 Tax=Zymomonas mobilis TaxID=542 RepID=UPI000B373729|nr:chemotaxis protein [Zymomonas mobilis]ART93669.1 chemotaxis protein [Zymomonas mobilis subsp. mobilis]TWD60386.1 hypothetical protein FBY50_1206 [Zymomonas mobilis]
MALPFIIMGAAAAATLFGGKKAIDGYQKKSGAEEIFDCAKERFETRKESFEIINNLLSQNLERLGGKELEIGSKFKDFDILAKNLLAKINKEGQKDLSIDIPQHRMDQIEKLSISAIEFLGSVVGAGASSAAAGFAVYGGVMAFAAASTGTPIAALSGAAAYNATMAAIGGGSLAAGGWGMAGGAMILGGAVVAPILAVLGWAYDSHADKALDNARKTVKEVNTYIEKMDTAEVIVNKIDGYVHNIYRSLVRMLRSFDFYFDWLKAANNKIKAGQEIDEPTPILRNIENGYMIAAVMTDVITTPLFKPMTDKNGKAIIKNGAIQLKTDNNGINILNEQALDNVLDNSAKKYANFLSKS